MRSRAFLGKARGLGIGGRIGGAPGAGHRGLHVHVYWCACFFMQLFVYACVCAYWHLSVALGVLTYLAPNCQSGPREKYFDEIEDTTSSYKKYRICEHDKELQNQIDVRISSKVA